MTDGREILMDQFQNSLESSIFHNGTKISVKLISMSLYNSLFYAFLNLYKYEENLKRDFISKMKTFRFFEFIIRARIKILKLQAVQKWNEQFLNRKFDRIINFDRDWNELIIKTFPKNVRRLDREQNMENDIQNVINRLLLILKQILI